MHEDTAGVKAGALGRAHVLCSVEHVSVSQEQAH